MPVMGAPAPENDLALFDANSAVARERSLAPALERLAVKERLPFAGLAGVLAGILSHGGQKCDQDGQKQSRPEYKAPQKRNGSK